VAAELVATARGLRFMVQSQHLATDVVLVGHFGRASRLRGSDCERFTGASSPCARKATDTGAAGLGTIWRGKTIEMGLSGVDESAPDDE
jgi:hypothetical protein